MERVLSRVDDKDKVTRISHSAPLVAGVKYVGTQGWRKKYCGFMLTNIIVICMGINWNPTQFFKSDFH